jgi:hypothetical protein
VPQNDGEIGIAINALIAGRTGTTLAEDVFCTGRR